MNLAPFNLPRERVRIPVPTVAGAHCTVWIEPLARHCFEASLSTSVPGWQGRAAKINGTFATRSAAIDAAVIVMRDYWRSRGVSAVVAALERFLEGWPEEVA